MSGFHTTTCPDCGAGIFSDASTCFVCGADEPLRPAWLIRVDPLDPDVPPWTAPVRRFPVTIGRDAAADIHIADRRVSREHLVLETGDGDVFVRELEVTNRGRLDGRPLVGIRRWHPDDPLILSGATLHLEPFVSPTVVVMQSESYPGGPFI